MGAFQKRKPVRKLDLCLTIAPLEALYVFSNSQLTWTDAASYEAALQKESTLCKHVTPEQCF